MITPLGPTNCPIHKCQCSRDDLLCSYSNNNCQNLMLVYNNLQNHSHKILHYCSLDKFHLPVQFHYNRDLLGCKYLVGIRVKELVRCVLGPPKHCSFVVVLKYIFNGLNNSKISCAFLRFPTLYQTLIIQSLHPFHFLALRHLRSGQLRFEQLRFGLLGFELL